MTAIIAAAQSGAAYLLTDGALYDTGGIVLALCSKTLIAEGMRLAMAPSGRCTSVDLERELSAAGVSTQAGVMMAMPECLRRIRARSVALGSTEPDCQVHVALWSDRAHEPQIWLIATDAPPCWGPYRPGTWLRVDAITGGDDDASEVLGRPVDLTSAASFDMEHDGGALIDHQRRTPWADGRFYVGGRAELVTVTRSGVTQRDIRRWPDRIGERINPCRSSGTL